MIPQPETRLVFSTDPHLAHRTEYRARKSHTHFIVYDLARAAHLGALGFEVESIIRDGHVVWRVPLTAKPAAHKYANTFRALYNGRKHAEATAAGGEK
jgi:hypothetical protein